MELGSGLVLFGSFGPLYGFQNLHYRRGILVLLSGRWFLFGGVLFSIG